MKKILTVTALTVGLAFSACASAMEVKTDGSAVSLKIPGGSEETMLVVVKSGGSISNNDDIFAVKLLSADEDGTLTSQFNMPDSRISLSQMYDVYTRKNGVASIEGSFAYAPKSARDGYLAKINAPASAAEMTALIDPDNPANTEAGIAIEYTAQEAKIILESMGVDTASLYGLSAQQRVSVATALANAAGALTESGTAETVNRAVAATLISTSQSASAVLDKCGLTFENEAYSEIKDSTKKAWIESCISANAAGGAQSIETAYQTACMLYNINNTRFDSMESVLSGYASSLGINSMTGYATYAALADKNKTNENLAAALKQTPATTASALDTLILSSISYVTPGGGSGGGTGGGGGGATLNSVSGKVPIQTPALNIGQTEPLFKDMDGAIWAETAVEKMVAAGIVSGDGDGNFRPNDTVTREEYVKMIVCAVKKYNASAKCSFDDVREDAWYYSYIASGVESELVFGISENEFGVGTPLTRQDMAVIAARAAKAVKEITPVRESAEFSDAEEISEYAKEDVDLLYRAGVINGFDGDRFAPTENATRAQSALVIYKLFLN